MGKFTEWSDVLSVGIDEIDSQHKALVYLVNEMHEAIHQRHGTDVTRDVLYKLADYTKIHFAVEETLMRILGYPDYEGAQGPASGAHSQHDGPVTEGRFREDCHRLRADALPRDLADEAHQESDQEYGQYFVEAGVKARFKRKSWPDACGITFSSDPALA